MIDNRKTMDALRKQANKLIEQVAKQQQVLHCSHFNFMFFKFELGRKQQWMHMPLFLHTSGNLILL